MNIMKRLWRMIVKFVDTFAGDKPELKAVLPWHEAALRGQAEPAAEEGKEPKNV